MSRRQGSVRSGRGGLRGDPSGTGSNAGSEPTANPLAEAPRASRGVPDELGRPDARLDAGAAGTRMAGARVPAAALLPMRFFFGVTFVYAGLDKLIDPAFFDAANPASIQAQLVEFARVSPLGPLVHLSEPFAVPIGLLIALAEIAIGLGAITGLAYRLAAAGGAALSLLFFLTASWSTSPYYFGPDLPYAAGWLTLALAGHAGLLVPRVILDLGRPVAEVRRRGWVPGAPPARRDRRARPVDDDANLPRRTVIQVGVLAIATLALATAATPLRLLRGSPQPGTASRDPSPRPGAAATGDPAPAATPTAAPSSAPAAGSLEVARVSDVPKGGAFPFTVPVDAPATLPAGDPAVIVQLASGSFVAYDAVCTHEGCTVEWAGQDSILFCPCHGAAFDAAHDAQVIQGPARRPLAPLPLVVDQSAGTISLQA